MLYFLLFLIRYLPFWAVPGALLLFDLGVYYYNQRERLFTVVSFSCSALFLVLTGLWVYFDGYWRVGMALKKLLQG